MGDLDVFMVTEFFVGKFHGRCPEGQEVTTGHLDAEETRTRGTRGQEGRGMLGLITRRTQRGGRGCAGINFLLFETGTPHRHD